MRPLALTFAFTNAHDSTTTTTSTFQVLLNMRMSAETPAEIALCGGHHCRFAALSTDGGVSFSSATPVPALVSSGCQGSIMLHPPSNRLLFTNPHSSTSRACIPSQLFVNSGVGVNIARNRAACVPARCLHANCWSSTSLYSSPHSSTCSLRL
jgi:hypothetical protein